MLIAFLALQSVIVAAWWRWLTPRSADLTDAERLMCAAVLAVAQIVGVSLLLGWGGVLSPRPLILLVVAATVVLLLSPLPPAQKAPEADAVKRGPARSARRRGDRRTRDRDPAESARAVSVANLVLLALLVPTLALIATRGVLAPNFGWDGLRYHLPISALMAQTGRFDFPPAHNPVISAYPKAAEIWVHWIIAFFGNDRWIGIAQLPFLFLAMLAVYNAARRFKSSRAAATTGALLFACVPLTLSQITVGYNDVFLVSVLLVAVAVVIAARQSAAPALPLSLGAALGLLLGTKYPALLFGSIIYASFALVVLRVRGRHALESLMLAAGLALLLGSDTYVRNWRLYGNPVYPYRSTVLGVKLPGPLHKMAVFGVAETKDMPVLERHYRSWTAFDAIAESDLFGGFGAAAPLILAVLVLSLVLAALQRDAARLWLFALFAILFLVTPLNFRLRFILYLVGLAGICLGDLLDRASWRWRAPLLAATVGAALVTVAQLWAVELPALRRFGRESADACRVAPKRDVRPAYLWMREHAPAGSTVLVFPPPEGPFIYCLWTPTFSNRVEFADAADPAALEQLAAARPDALFFVPLQSPIYGVLQRTEPRRWRALFTNEAVMILTPAPPAT